MGRHSNTQVWEYFDYISDRLAECHTCKARIATPPKATYNLKRHLLTLHGINTYLKGKYKDKILEKSERWKLKTNPIRSADNGNDEDNGNLSVTEKDDVNILRNNMIENDNNHIVSTEEEDETYSVVSINLPIKKSLPENNMHKMELEDNYNENKNFQDDLLPKTNIAISSVYSATNPLRNSSPIPSATIENSHRCIELEKLKAEALVAKYKAEARYFNELADLTHSKRVFVDLQCQQLRKQFQK